MVVTAPDGQSIDVTFEVFGTGEDLAILFVAPTVRRLTLP